VLAAIFEYCLKPVGAAAGCDLLISKNKIKDRSLVALDSSYRKRSVGVGQVFEQGLANPGNVLVQ
jgi:hypothetical protein